MTNEQAIDLLDNLIGFVEDNQNNDYDTALNMAIEALSAQSEHDCALTMWGECSYNETGCSDCEIKAKITRALGCNKSDNLISRSDNRGEVWWLGKRCENCGDERCKKLGVLPKGYSCALWKDGSYSEKPNESDTIYRQDAIDAIGYGSIHTLTREEREDLIRQLPSAQPEQTKYEYHYDHTDCIWYRPEARNRCPTTCAQYRDGWNDAMNYIFRDGKGYRPYRRDKQYGE